MSLERNFLIQTDQEAQALAEKQGHSVRDITSFFQDIGFATDVLCFSIRQTDLFEELIIRGDTGELYSSSDFYRHVDVMSENAEPS